MVPRLLGALQEVWERTVTAPHLLLCLDFDGALVPVAEDTASASVSDPLRETLEALTCEEQVSVAVFSGRSCADLRERVGVFGVIYAGNHGLEITGCGASFVEPTAAEVREPLRALAADLAARLQPFAGIRLEDRGLSLSISDRLVSGSDAEAVRRAVHAALASTSHPFVLTGRRHVYEIRPRVYWTKADAAAWIKGCLGHLDALTIHVVGDPAADSAVSATVEGIVVKVGPTNNATAQYSLGGPAEVQAFLDWLADRVR